MKTMTCRELGGMCDEPITASTKDEMMGKGMAHLEVAHPQMAADVKAMPPTDPKMVEWNTKFNADWDAKPEDVA